MKKNIVILGSTGSIGQNTFNIISKDKKNFDIKLLSTNKNVSEIMKQAKEFKVKNIIINDYNEFIKAKLKNKNKNITIFNNFEDIDKILKDNSKVAQTIFVKIPILIIRNHSQDQKKSFDLHINRSHANYLKELLLDGCNQFIN